MTDDDIVSEARTRFKLCQDFESLSREHFRWDTRFYWGDAYNMYQWPDEQARPRLNQNKPCLTVNKTKVHCDQIINDGLQNKPGISIRPVGAGASFDAATIFESIIRSIEYHSNADEAYSTAAFNQVVGGIGWWRIVTDYKDENSFDQEIFIRRIPDAMSVYLDPGITQYEGDDADFAFVFVDMATEKFNKLYPNHEGIGSEAPLGFNDEYHEWHTEHTVRVAEYYRRVMVKDRLHVMPTGETFKESEVDDKALLPQIRKLAVRSRVVQNPKIEWYKIAGSDIIERNEWAGRYIPLVRCVGQEFITDGVLDRRGHVRALLDAARAYNVNVSAGMEATGLQTKIPYLVTPASIEGFEDQWARANTTNFAYLQWNDWDDVGGREVPKPERIEPAIYPGAYLQGLQIARDDMEMATGQYASQFGAEGNERSAKAINERQRQGSNATYHFINNLAKSIRYTGRILIDLIPRIYDTPRVMKILAQDGTLQTVQLDPNAPQAHREIPGIDVESYDPQQVAAIFNPNVGEYSIEADIQPSYATKRQEAFNAISQILEENPQAFQIMGDLWARMSDFPDADIIANRLRNMVPPQALGQGPSPEVQQAQQHIAMQHQVIDAQTKQIDELKSKSLISEQQKEIDEYKAQTDRMKAVGSIDPEAMKPIIRQMVSEALATQINPLIHAHALEAAVTANAVKQINPDVDPAQEQTPQ